MMHPQQGIMVETLEAHESLQKALAEAHTGPWPLKRLANMTLLEFLCIAGPNRIRFTYEGPIDGEFHGPASGDSAGEAIHCGSRQDADVSIGKSLATLDASAVPSSLPIRPTVVPIRPIPNPPHRPSRLSVGNFPDRQDGDVF